MRNNRSSSAFKMPLKSNNGRQPGATPLAVLRNHLHFTSNRYCTFPVPNEFEILNERPIIGILAQELPGSLEEFYNGTNFTSYIGAAYVKYIEAAGARVVPILINQDDEYYKLMFNSTNGLLIPGGAVSLTDSGKIFFNPLK